MFSDSEESSLTSISDLEDYEPSSAPSEDETYNYVAPRRASTVGRPSTGRKKEKEPKRDYVITNALRPPRTTQYTAKSLYDQIVENSIDLDPEYQRDIVWTEAKQSGLIDSILRHYYIPPIIFAVVAQDDGTEQRVCIDGKQRLTAIQRFMDGLIPHKDSFTNERLYYKQTPGCKTKRRLLPKAYINRFGNEQICCVEYDGLNSDQEREIFQRVQLGVALTPAERMQALNGPLASYLRTLQQRVLGPAPQGFGDTLEWSSERGRAFQGILMIVYFIEQYPKCSPIPQTETLTRYLGKDGVGKQLEGKIRDMFDVYIKLAADSKYKAVFSRPTRLSPIEFVMFGVMIYAWMEVKPPRGKKDKDGQWMEKLDLKALVEALKTMRKTVREKHADVRANSKVTKTMAAFITKTVKDLKNGKSDVPSDPKGMKRKKRKRVDSDDEMADQPLSLRVSRIPAKLAKADETTESTSTSPTAALPKIMKRKGGDDAGARSRSAAMGKMVKKSVSASSTSTSITEQRTEKAKRSNGVSNDSTSGGERVQEKASCEQGTARGTAIPQARTKATSRFSKPQSAPSTPILKEAEHPIQMQAASCSTVEVTTDPRLLSGGQSLPSPGGVKPEVASPQVSFVSPTIPPPTPPTNMNGSNPVYESSVGVTVKREQDTSLLDRLAPIRRARGVADTPSTISRSITPSGAPVNAGNVSTGAQVTQDPRRLPLPALQVDASQLHSLTQQQLQQTTPGGQPQSAMSSTEKQIQEEDIEKLLVAAGIKLDNAQMASIMSGPNPGAVVPQPGPAGSVMTPTSPASNMALATQTPSVGISYPPNVNICPSPLPQSASQPWSIPLDNAPAAPHSGDRASQLLMPSSRTPPRQPRADRSISEYTSSQTSVDSRRARRTPTFASYDDDRGRDRERRSSYYDERRARSRHDYDYDYKEERDRNRDRPREKYRYRSRSRSHERGRDRYEQRRDYGYDGRESDKGWSTRRVSKSPDRKKRV
ncbi:hypothetical protein NEOLEDRAFT_1140615 [Neolentinus lepideus HHB14362 ss-1]|uniref:GmrSD restriction endonucleases N-terminal domain-containing protein n=1 Tax=Neolentinus lepideus HHB14362 ss-1 TaxID=1314782 RepID=A0A165P4I8_9AGAM|nr:hypothetical protein NEOLEDRAFT_1140615 [Neolentinus lepideus HHB14362 ss-1]